ncbi:MAG TPA: gliding motility protein GldN [Bacteroidia bacterium]|nr:gliding motility protein GldN [Bacteroidia bacterium]HNT80456.1 gliding motility protein GldN [Bacteroidia bacterium]
MKKALLVLLVGLLMSTPELMAQNLLDGVYVKEHNPTRRVVPYSYLREADVMWARRVWRVIELNEKLNLPLRYPREGDTKDRKSLIEVLMDAIEEGSLTAYNYIDDEFTMPMTMEEFEKVGGAGVDTIQVIDPDPPYLSRDTVVKREFSRDKIVAYRVKEEVFFDKQRSLMESRIIGIAPLMWDEDDQGNIREGAIKKPIFWVYFPEARRILVNNEVFNRQNDAARLTFDDIFMKRMFTSYIMKESNVFNRRVEEYRVGMDALLESERIKQEHFNIEHDLWEY